MDARALSAGALIALAVVACGDNVSPPVTTGVTVDSAYFPATPRTQLDLLVLVDNSPGTAEDQLPFATALPRFFAVLDELDAMPSLHVGVATSDLGTLGSSSATPGPDVGSGIGSCRGRGGDGVFTHAGLHAGETFLTVDGGVTNADADAITTLAAQVEIGAAGCGFEQHLAGMRRALTNPANGAFLRPDANLAIVILADEDDCSVRDPALFGADDATLGPLDSFRCTHEGLVCNEDLDSVGVKTGCHAKPDSRYIDDVATFVDFVAALKPDRRQIMTAAVVGDPAPVAVELVARAPGAMPSPRLAASCQFPADGRPVFADPAVRDVQFASSFGGAVESVCHADQAAQLAELGHAVKRLMGDSCVAGDASGSCTVTDELADGSKSELPACPASGACYRIGADAKACPDTAEHLRVVVTRASPPPAGTYVRVRCAMTP